MACNLFDKQVVRENGKIVKVLDNNGKESKLYKDVKEYLEINPHVIDEFSEVYIEELMKAGKLEGDSLEDLGIDEIALGVYSRIYTPTYVNQVADWENFGDGLEPTFEEAKGFILSPPSKRMNESGLPYEPQSLSEVLIPIIDNLENLDADQIHDLLLEEGLYIPVSVIEETKAAYESKPARLHSMYGKAMDKFSPDEVHRIYGPLLGKDRSEVEQDYYNKKQTPDSPNNVIENLGEQATEDEVSNALVNSVKRYVPEHVMDLFKRIHEGTNMYLNGTNIKSVSGLKNYWKNIKKNFKEVSKDFEITMDIIGIMLPTLKSSGYKVIIHSEPASYWASLEAKGETDMYKATTPSYISGNEIHLNLRSHSFDGRAPIHEFLHPILEAVIKENPELVENIREAAKEDYKESNPLATDEPGLEEMINYLSNQVYDHLHDSKLSLDHSSSLRETIKSIIKAIENFFGFNNSELLDVYLRDSQSVEGFIDSLNNTLTGRAKVNFKKYNVMFEEGVRFSDPSSEYRNKEAGLYAKVMENYGMLVDSDGNPRTGLLKAIKELGLSKKRFLKILSEGTYVDSNGVIRTRYSQKSFRKSTMADRIKANKDMNHQRKSAILNFLEQKFEYVLTDSAVESIFRDIYASYRKSRGGTSVTMWTSMINDIIGTDSLPDSVKLFMLSNILDKHYSSLSTDLKNQVLTEIDAIRTDWGRTGRFLQNRNNGLFGGLGALSNWIRQQSQSSKNGGKSNRKALSTLDKIAKGFVITKEQTNKLVEALKVLPKYGELKVDRTMYSHPDVRRAVGVLRSYGIKVSTPKGERAIGGPTDNSGQKPNLGNLSEAQLNSIIDSYLRLTEGDTIKAKVLFEKALPGQGNYFNLTEQLLKMASTYKRSSMLHRLSSNLQDVIDGKSTSIKNPDLFLIRKMIEVGGYYTKGTEGQTLAEAAKDLRGDIMPSPGAVNESVAITLAETVLDYMHDYTNSERATDKLYADDVREAAYKMIGAFTQNEVEPYAAKGTIESMTRGIYDTVKRFVEEYYSSDTVQGRTKDQFITDLMTNYNIPYEVAQQIKDQIDKNFDGVVKESLHKTLSKLLRDYKITGNLKNKLLNLAKTGALDRQTLIDSGLGLILGIKTLPPSLIRRLRELNIEYQLQRSETGRAQVSSKLDKILTELKADGLEILSALISESFYGGALSAPTTLFNVAFGTMATGAFVTTSISISHVLSGVMDIITDGNINEFKALAYATKEALFGGPGLAHVLRTVGQIFMDDNATNAELYRERGDGMKGSIQIQHTVASNRLKEMWGSFKDSKNLIDGAKRFIAAIINPDVGGIGLETKLAEMGTTGKVIKHGVRLGTLLLAIATGVGVGAVFPAVSGVTPILFAGLSLGWPILARGIVVMDYLFTGSMQRFITASEASKISNSNTKANRKAFKKEYKELMGKDPYSVAKLEDIIDVELVEMRDQMEAEGEVFTPKKWARVADKYRNKRRIELAKDMQDPDIVDGTNRLLRMITLSSIPPGFLGKVVTSFKSLTTTPDTSSGKSVPQRLATIPLMFLRFAVASFVNPMAWALHMGLSSFPLYQNISGISGVSGGTLFGNKLSYYDPSSRTYNKVDMTMGEQAVYGALKILSLAGVTSFAYAAGFLPGDDDEEEDIGNKLDKEGNIKFIQKHLGLDVRITGGGGSSGFLSTLTNEGYNLNSIQVKSKDSEEYTDIFNTSFAPYLAPIISPISYKTDLKLLESGPKQREEANRLSNIDFIKYIQEFQSTALGQSFGENMNKTVDIFSTFLFGKDVTDVEMDAMKSELMDMATEPMGTMVEPNSVKFGLKALADIQGKARPDSQKDFVKDPFDNYVVRQSDIASLLKFDQKKTDQLGFPIPYDVNIPKGVETVNLAFKHFLGKELWTKDRLFKDASEHPFNKWKNGLGSEEIFIKSVPYTYKSFTKLLSGNGYVGAYMDLGDIPSNATMELAKHIKRKTFADSSFNQDLNIIMDSKNSLDISAAMERLFGKSLDNNDITRIKNSDGNLEPSLRYEIVNNAIEKRAKKSAEIAYRIVMSDFIHSKLQDHGVNVSGFDVGSSARNFSIVDDNSTEGTLASQSEIDNLFKEHDIVTYIDGGDIVIKSSIEASSGNKRTKETRIPVTEMQESFKNLIEVYKKDDYID